MISMTPKQKAAAARIANGNAANGRGATLANETIAEAKEPPAAGDVAGDVGRSRGAKKNGKRKPALSGRPSGPEVKAPLSDADREELLQIVRDRRPELEGRLRSLGNIFDRGTLIYEQLFEHTLSQGRPGELRVTACPGGMQCWRDERAGLVPYAELLDLLGLGENQLVDENPFADFEKANLYVRCACGHVDQREKFGAPREIMKCPICARANGLVMVTATTFAEYAARNEKEKSTAGAEVPGGKQRKLQTPPPASAVAEGMPSAADEVVAANVALAMIEPNPWQPRTDWERAGIEELAASMKANGQLQRVLVRPTPQAARGKPSYYQIADGERRFRAAKLAGLTQIAVDVRALSDEQMAEFALISNVQRKDLNPIEKAAALKRLQDKFHYTQERLGQVADVGGQAKVSIVLRLLDLPEAWQKLLADGTLSVSHARLLLPYVDLAGKFKYALKRIVNKGAPSLDAFRDDVADELNRLGRDIDDHRFSSKHGQRIPMFAISDADRAKLDIREVPKRWLDGVSNMAFNVPLFDKLWKAHEKAFKPPALRAGSGSKPKAKDNPAVKLTPAQERAKAAKVEKQTIERLKVWRTNWLRWLIHEALEEATHGSIQRILLYFAAGQAAHRWSWSQRAAALRNSLGAMGVRRDGWSYPDVLGAVAKSAFEKVDLAIADFLKAAFWTDKGANEHVPASDVATIAELLGIDPNAAWRSGKLAGPLTESFFNIHNKAQLRRLAETLHLSGIDTGQPKSKVVREFMEHPGTSRFVPASIAAGKKKPAKKAKAKARGAR